MLCDIMFGDNERYFDGLPDDIDISNIDFITSRITNLKNKIKELKIKISILTV